MKKLLIIGGSGFFGKSILDLFQRGGLEKWDVGRVVAMSRHAEQLKNVAPQLLDERVELVNADIGRVNSLPVADYVIHAAASTDTRNYLSKPEIEKNNIQAGVYNYCRLAPEYHPYSKIVYVSSGAVYGVQPPDMAYLEEDKYGDSLDDLPQHKRDYAVAKRDAELAISMLCEQHRLRACVARCFAFVGPWLPRDQHFAIGNFLRDGLDGRPIEVKANYPVYRSYMHADDLVNWMMTMAVAAGAQPEVFNVGSDQEISMIGLAEVIAKEFTVPVSKVKQTEVKLDRYIPSIKKAREKLGLDLKFDLVESIRNTINRIRV